MARSSISVDDRNLLRQLRNLDKVTEKNVTRRVLRRAAAPMRDQAREDAPKKSGDLARSIKTYVSAKKGEGTGKVESRLPYAHLVELGTKPHWQKRRLGRSRRRRRVLHPGAQPKPFMRPAFDQEKDNSVGIARRELKKEIEKEAKKKG